MHKKLYGIVFFILMLSGFYTCKQKSRYKEMEVTATAYNSVASQTWGNPFITAWGDTLKPGTKAIAVSRDLIDSGLVHKTVVTIEGFPGEYIVMDKMNARWTKKIDIYMDDSIQKAREWGKQKVIIRWKPEE